MPTRGLLDQVIEFYHTTLNASPEALEYLEGEAREPELIERFRLGYANRTLAYRLAPKQYKAGAQMRTALQRIGILRESGHEHLNGSIVVPLFGRVRRCAAPRGGRLCAKITRQLAGRHAEASVSAGSAPRRAEWRRPRGQRR